MKKLALSLAVLFSVAFVACNNSAKEAEETVVAESAEQVVEESAVGDSPVDESAAVETPAAE